LLPPWVARLAGFAALAALGALEWQRMIGGLSSGRALLWVLGAVAVALALVRVPRARHPRLALFAVVIGAVALAVVVSGLHLALLGPRRWGDLFPGLSDGASALGTVALPYSAASPWPAVVLELLGALLLVWAALMAFWPRRDGERGYPFLALVLLLVLVVSPVVSMGGAAPVLLGAVLTTLCVCFLWLERLPLRPGGGVAALLGIALAGALPIAATADRGDAWFDYRSFAEGLGPNDPIHFSWNQGYGPIDWPRDGNEVMRVKSDQPYYWKAANLEDFNGVSWQERKPGEVQEPSDGDVPEDWRNRPGWTSTIEVQIKRLTSRAVVSAGTTMGVESSSQPLERSGLPGSYQTVSTNLRRGDSYTLQVHVPRPAGGALAQADSGLFDQQADDLQVALPLKHALRYSTIGRGSGRVRSVVLHTRPFGDKRKPYLELPNAGRSLFSVDRVIRRNTRYWRTWQLAQRLKRGTKTPLEYVIRVNRYLQTGFSYSERPQPVRAGVEPLDGFLFDTKEGYCQHFSGAMALLLRMGGVPARVASGFSPGGFSKRHDAWIVRDTDAHAWVEAWFDRNGWVTYDPTPSATPARSQIAALTDPPPAAPSASSSVTAGGGAANGGRTALRGDLRFDLLRDSAAGPPSTLQQDNGTPWWVFVLIALAVVGLVALAAWRFLLHRGKPLQPMDRALAELEAALRRTGRSVTAGTTLRQLEKRLGGSPEAIGYLRALSATRYGADPAPPTPAQRAAMRRALAEGLGLAGRVRAWWALPPRPR
jgi:transglutaminase-like putative cysteine protease